MPTSTSASPTTTTNRHTSDDEEEDGDVRGSTRVGAEDEVGAGAKSAEGDDILEEIPTPKSSQKQKKMGTTGGREGGRPRGEKGYRSKGLGGKLQWDPGSS